MDDFEHIWTRIESHVGETFHQELGGEFTYQVRSGMVMPDRTNHQLPRSHFREAFARMPVAGPADLQDLRGPSYLFAILTDPRIVP